MEFTLWISFVATVIILAFTPGPSVLLATANSMKYGSAKTVGTILGDLMGSSVSSRPRGSAGPSARREAPSSLAPAS